MKKKQLIGGVILVIAIVVLVSIFYPPADESESKGTIGKVDKYRSDKTGQEEVKLRSEFIQDTTALRGVIISLQMYENYLIGLSNDFKEWESTLNKIDLDQDELNKQLDQLNQLAVFIDNNLTTVANTKELLEKYYSRDTTDMSVDVGNNLIQFSDFVTNLDQKAKVFDELFQNLNGLISEEELAKLSLSKEETESLKEVRDKMLGGSCMLAFVMGNEERLNMALGSEVLNGVILNRQLNNTLGLLVLINIRENLGAKNQEQLNFFNKENLGTGFTASEQLQNNEQLGLFAINEALNNKQLGALFNTEALGITKSLDGVFVFAKDNLESTTSALNNASFLANQNLGAFRSQETLQAFRSFSNTMGMFNQGREGLGNMLRFQWI
ncbi:MAG: hypothetical protein U5K00_15235 [Melioribacteraceae bacterium]|nr:hypothetical protein [Melioribacteraceae bacterium]